MSQIRSVYDALVSALAVIDGTGSYNHDVSAADRRVRDSVIDPDTLPMLAILLEEVREENGEELGDFTETATFRIFGFVSGTTIDSATRVGEACDLLDDIRRAIRVDRSLGGLVIDTLATGRAFMGSELDLGASFGVVSVTVTVHWFEDGGL